MSICVDAAYRSLNKYGEPLCGDKVEIIKAADSNIMILTDGMGSGVKANILATLTSKILGTMILNGASLEQCVDTIVRTLPVCQVRQVAYSTFSILQIYDDGEAYLVEYDNPGCIFLRNGKLMDIPRRTRVIQGKEINEYRFHVENGDTFLLISDGAVHAGVGALLNFGWSWPDIADYAVRMYYPTISAARLASIMSQSCDELYDSKPGDDTTVGCVRVTNGKCVHLMTGPAGHPRMDEQMVRDFLDDPEAITIVCGGTSSSIVSRVTGKEMNISLDYNDPEIPPIAYMDGVDLVTEGVLTLNRVVELLKQYNDSDINEEFFKELDRPNGGSMVAKVLIEECTDVCLYVGKATNGAYHNPGLPFSMGIRQNLVGQLCTCLETLGKTVTVKYY